MARDCCQLMSCRQSVGHLGMVNTSCCGEEMMNPADWLACRTARPRLFLFMRQPCGGSLLARVGA